MPKKQRSRSGFFLLILIIAVVLLAFALYFCREPLSEAANSASDFVAEGAERLSEEFSPSLPSEDAFLEDDALPPLEDAFVALPEGLELPSCPAKNHAGDHELRRFSNYAICYRESYEQAEWSAYSLSDFQLEKNASRSNDFRPDPQISTQSAALSDYKGSGYDRGHLTPAADMAFSEEAMSETFFMSNMSPQSPQFNRGIWKNLEAQVRVWARTFGRVYVVSGAVLDKAAEEYASIGGNLVSVPEFYYKVILAPLYEDASDRASPGDSKSVIAIGFIIPNQKCDDDFWSYAVSIDEVERRTRLDFYPLLQDDAESRAEAAFDLGMWQ